MTENAKILWADDEIELLKPYVLFLSQKGYTIDTVNSGDEAIDMITGNNYDMIFLDENMPGLSGIETLEIIKNKYPNLPVVMITKSEEELIMEGAIGSKISDYLIKPVNPNQILLSIKKTLQNKKLISEKTTQLYQQQFMQLSNAININLSYDEWVEIYKKIAYWELELSNSTDDGVLEIFKTQKAEANNIFAKFIERNYVNWLNVKTSEKPILSHTVFKERIMPLASNNELTFLLLIDNLRYDQWKFIQPLIENYFRVDTDDMYCTILPTATHYARNALFAGLMPSEIEKLHSKYWLNEEDEGIKNQFEEALLTEQLKRLNQHIKYSYNKILNLNAAKKLSENISNLYRNKLNVIVYNFVDMLSHARTDMEVIKELADDEPAYRSLTYSWFEHSPLFEIMKALSKQKVKIIITADHGSIKVERAIKVIGDKNTSTNLRYKQGKALQYNPKEVFEILNPADVFLPKQHINTRYIFAKPADFFVYPNNYNHFVNYYKNTFQHGGISLEEMLVPYVVLSNK